MTAKDTVQILLVDNYDSYTFNLYHLIGSVNGCPPRLIQNDEPKWREVLSSHIDGIVISPGPGHPARPEALGICSELLRSAQVPILGVCLGYQGMIYAAGGLVERQAQPTHGQISTIHHCGSGLFDGIPQAFRAVRYHSLSATTVPTEFEVIARADDRTIMAVQHRNLPRWGVQFHPESVATEYGTELVANFLDVCRQRAAARIGRPPKASIECCDRPPEKSSILPHIRKIKEWHDPERVFEELYASSDSSFWLDGNEHNRFSYLGDANGPQSEVVSYRLATDELTLKRSESTECRHDDIFSFLKEKLEAFAIDSSALPFDFVGGFVGYFGYELKALCGGKHTNEAQHPDAYLLFCDRVIVIDRVERCTYLVVLGGEASAAAEWFDQIEQTLALLSPEGDELLLNSLDIAESKLQLDQSYMQYLESFERCQEALLAGESYELCLTDELAVSLDIDAFHTYRCLRKINPGPYSAYLRFGDLAVLSSSPERFLRLERTGVLESKPIKGTCQRGKTLIEDKQLREGLRTHSKSRAENLMITDLMRSDLGKVCEIGSIEVPNLMDVESYSTVHQLVSTVRGQLLPELTAVDAMRACFPPGSLTGAPKLRAMEILDQIEQRPRGIYCGALGYLSCNGCADLGTVIRTVVLDRQRAIVGTGGAVLTASDPASEFAEMRLKASALLSAIAHSSRSSDFRSKAL